jgi:2-hydroxy-4-carboxymuconate semialdehyde hemiacetal dehydrogenase
MELASIIETGDEQAIVCTGSYHSSLRIFDVLVVTDRDTYHLDILSGRMVTSGGASEVDGEEANNAQVARDFIVALVEGREPLVTGASVLPAMRLLQQFENAAREIVSA